MKVIRLKNQRVAERLRKKLLTRGYVFAQVSKEEELKRDFLKKADLVILLEDRKLE